MSKRYFPQQLGDRKRAKLDISMSDHNFPLSQNKEPEHADTWGDDNDDEILLLASQACEQVYNNDVSLLSDYSICMNPGTTSTQLNPTPSTSKTEFTFKKPSPHPSNILSTNLKDKCPRISSPLPGISSKVMKQMEDPVNLTDDLIFTDKIYQGLDSEQVYKQLLQLQEENAKLKSENGKLLEKCVTKEGEASILRTQLKSCQVSVDNARLEKVKAQEKVQVEWTEKLTAANNQMHDLRNQLDFKNLEIISIKEKCKKLESSKVRLTQVTLNNNDTSQRINNTYSHNNSLTHKKVSVSSNSVQTDSKAHFVSLNTTISTESPPISSVLPLILDPCTSDQYQLLDYNEKLLQTETPQKCLVYNTFHRIPNTPTLKESRRKVQINTVYEDVVCIANGSRDKDCYFNFFKALKSILSEVRSRIDTISRRMTTAFQKEMDEKYIEVSAWYLDVNTEDLLKGSSLYREEQDVLARRLTATLAYVIKSPIGSDMLHTFENGSKTDSVLQILQKICRLIDDTSCATLYSGLLSSTTLLLQHIYTDSLTQTVINIVKSIISSRPCSFVVAQLLELVVKTSEKECFRNMMCPGTNAGNLKTDYDQGVLLYKKDSCHLQIYLKQVESCLKCIQNQKLSNKAAHITRYLIKLYSNINTNESFEQNKSRCDCQLLLIQVIVYSLRICAVMLDILSENETREPLSVCRCGLQPLSQCSARDPELGARLAHHEGHLLQFCEAMKRYTHSDTYGNMLSELTGTLQSSPEDMPPSFHKQPWLKSFQIFSIAD